MQSTDFTSTVGNETWYLFGDQVEAFWDGFLQDYAWPAISDELKARDPNGYFQTAAFGIGGVASGVPFHIHGGGWSEVIHGAKHWYGRAFSLCHLVPASVLWLNACRLVVLARYLFDLSIGNEHPQDDRDQSQWDWTRNSYPKLTEEQRASLYECTIYPGMWPRPCFFMLYCASGARHVIQFCHFLW